MYFSEFPNLFPSISFPDFFRTPQSVQRVPYSSHVFWFCCCLFPCDCHQHLIFLPGHLPWSNPHIFRPDLHGEVKSVFEDKNHGYIGPSRKSTPMLWARFPQVWTLSSSRCHCSKSFGSITEPFFSPSKALYHLVIVFIIRVTTLHAIFMFHLHRVFFGPWINGLC